MAAGEEEDGFQTHVNFIHDGGKSRVLLVQGVDCVDCRVEVLDVLCVHLEEGRELDEDVSYPPLLGPKPHALANLHGNKKEGDDDDRSRD